MDILTFITTAIISYLVGSISFAVIFSNIFGLDDPREHGSSNPGATNMFRIGGAKVALLTFACDALKGYLPMIVARFLGFDYVDCAIVGLMSLLGHLYPIFFNFNGGKGLATMFGLVFGFSHFTGLLLFGIWMIVYIQAKVVSLASLITACVLPLISMALFGIYPSIIFFIMSCLVVYAHRSNIQSLLNGNEEKTEIFNPKGV